MRESFEDKVVLTLLSPRFYRVTTHWSDPDWGVEEFLFIRSYSPGPFWTNEENEIMCKYYPMMPREELLKLMPNRTWYTLLLRAIQLNILEQSRKIQLIAKRYLLE